MKKFIAIAAIAMGLAVPAAGAVEAAKPAPGVATETRFLAFGDAEETVTFEVDAAQGAGVLTVETQDCCIAGDIWVAFAAHGQPRGNDAGTGVGNGSIGSLSGPVSVKGWSKGTVTISYDSGTDVFPAGMVVRFTYTSNGNGAAKGNTGMVITELP
jgi:hypothetical protein